MYNTMCTRDAWCVPPRTRTGARTSFMCLNRTTLAALRFATTADCPGTYAAKRSFPCVIATPMPRRTTLWVHLAWSHRRHRSSAHATSFSSSYPSFASSSRSRSRWSASASSSSRRHQCQRWWCHRTNPTDQTSSAPHSPRSTFQKSRAPSRATAGPEAPSARTPHPRCVPSYSLNPSANAPRHALLPPTASAAEACAPLPTHNT